MSAAAATGLSRRLVARGAAWTAASTLLLRFGNIAVTVVVARLLSPRDFGVFALALAVYVIISSVAELGLASYIARSADEPADTAPTVTTLALVVSGLLSLLLLLGAGPLASLAGSPAAAGSIRVLSLSLLLTGLLAVPSAQLTREFRQDRIFLATVAGFVPGNLALVLLALQGSGAEAFAWSRVVGQVVTAVVLLRSVSRVYLPGFVPRLVPAMLAFGLPLCFANLVNWTLLNADYVVVGRMLSEAAVGTYLIAFTVSNWSTVVIGPILNSVVVPGFARVDVAPASRAAALLDSMGLVALVTFPVGALIVALSQPLVVGLYGARWTAAAGALSVLALYGVAFAFCLLFANVLVAIGRTGPLLLVQLLWIATLVPTMLWTVHYGLVGVAWAHVAVIGLVVLPYYWVVVRRDCPVAAGDLGASMLRVGVPAAAAGLVARVVAVVVPTDWGRLLAGGAAGTLLYAALVAPLVARHLPDAAAGRVTQVRTGVVLLLQRAAAHLPTPVRRTARAVASRGLGAHSLDVSTPAPEDWRTPLLPAAVHGVLPQPVTTASAPAASPSVTMRCLVATSSLDVGGMDAFVDFLARGLRTRGAAVTVMVAGDDPGPRRLAHGLEQDGFDVLFTEPATVADQLAAIQPDCVSVHGVPDWMVEAAAMRRVPVVETIHGMHSLWDRERLARRAQWLAAVVAVSQLVRAQFLSWVPSMDPARVVVVPNGVRSCRQPASVRERTRAALGLGEEFVFVSLGRFCLQKNTYGLLSAFDAVAAEVPDAHLLMAGRVDDRAYYSQVLRRCGRSPYRDRVHLRDHAAHPALLLAAADAFVLDSFFEGWSLASTEALTAGLPVVLSEVGGAVEQVAWDRPPGRVVPNPLGSPLDVTWDAIAAARFRRQPNVEELVGAMVGVADERETWRGERDRIASEAERRFSPQACLEDHLDVLLRCSDALRTTSADGLPEPTQGTARWSR